MFESLIKEEVREFELRAQKYHHAGKAWLLDLHVLDQEGFHLLYQGRSHRVWIHEIDQDQQEVVLSINGKKTRVHIRSQLERLLRELGLDQAMAHKIDQVKAPMPGLIKEVEVEAGETVEKGQALFILEAMKMENVIKSPAAGTVAHIAVTPGQSVDKGQLLLRME